jgi:lysophospholipase L1-like esterase
MLKTDHDSADYVLDGFRGKRGELMNVKTRFKLLVAAVLVAAWCGVLTADAGSQYSPIPLRVNYGSGYWGGVTGAPVASGKRATADVLVVGDSITARCYPALRTALAAKGKTSAVVAQSGADIWQLTDLLMGDQLTVPPVVVMAAGTNNVFNPFGASAQVARAANWTNQVGSKLYWVDTYVGRPAYLASDIRNSGQVNAAIYATVPNVIGWTPALTSAVGRGRALSYYLQDGVHPWAAAGTGHGNGCAYWAGVIASRL